MVRGTPKWVLTLVTAPLSRMFCLFLLCLVWGENVYDQNPPVWPREGGEGCWTWTSREKCREIGRKVHKNDYLEDQRVAELGSGVGKRDGCRVVGRKGSDRLGGCPDNILVSLWPMLQGGCQRET